MTKDEQRIAIAEWCGFKQIRKNDAPHYAYQGPVGTLDGSHFVAVPDYCNDLNAMAEAEKKLPDERFEDYWNQLLKLCIPKANHQRHWSEDVGWICTTDATASQRAEAMCRTLWPERFKNL